VGGNDNLAHIIAFFLIFGLVGRLIGVAFWIVGKVLGIFSFIPFMKAFDRLLGAAVGLLEGTMALGLLLYFAGRFPVTVGFGEALAASQFAPQFLAIGAVLAPLLPLAIRALKSVI
jgi:Colicin V production protein